MAALAPVCLSINSPFRTFSLTIKHKYKRTSFKSRKSLVHSSASEKKQHDPIVRRPLANFSAQIWGDVFTSFTFPIQEFESYTREVNTLKEEFKVLLMENTSYIMEKMNFIDTICRLGLAYHFHTEIENELDKMFHHYRDHLFCDGNYDLYNVALAFRVFRQHGFKVSSDVFKNFVDNDGKFKNTLANDAKSMLSLYEATHLSFHGEYILDEALSFSRACLESSMENDTITLSSNMRQQILHAFEQAPHRRVQRVEASKYIHLYKKDEERNEKLLKFAISDYNRVQLLHQQELKDILSWWNDSKLLSEYPYIRDRVAELYSWGVSIQFEPQYEQARRIFTQIIVVMIMLDDTYDAYGTYDELKTLSQAIQRWNIDAVDILPDYLKFYYRYLLSLFDQLEKEMDGRGRSFSVAYAKDLVVEASNSFFDEASWLEKGYVPSYDEYLRVASVSVLVQLLAGASFLGMEQVAGIDSFEWLKSKPKLLASVNVISRLIDDIMSHKGEQKRRHVASAVECCMKQHGLSEEEVVKDLKTKVVNEWKTLNEECMRPFPVSVYLVSHLVNIARIVDSMYKYGNALTEPEFMKDFVRTMFISKIPM